MKPTVSVVISAFNEEHAIERCLASVAFADEIIVVDNHSSDNTSVIAKKFTKLVFDQPNKLMLNINKNYGFTRATGDWILNLDADELISPALSKEIQLVLRSDPKENGFWIKRKNFSFGKWIQHGLWWPDKQIRLFRRGKGEFPCVHIHEYIKIDGLVGELTEPYVHNNYESIHQYLTKIDRASTSEALSLKEVNYQLSWYDAIRFPVSDFLKIYFAQQGFKDGLHGLVLALFQAFYSFAVFAKVWEMQGFSEREITPKAIREEFLKRAHEVKYWIVTMMIGDTENIFTKIKGKIERKFISIKHE
jgi:glycosyltransferase involved in cell wall biosynthesis